PFGNQPLPRTMKRLQVGLCLALQRDKTHRWTKRCLCNRLGVAVVVLLCLDVRANILRRHQSDLVALRRELTPQMMRAAARFHCHYATRRLASKSNHRWPLQTTPHQDPPAIVQSDHTANILTQVDPKHRDIHRSAPPPLLAKRSYRIASRGAGHPIISDPQFSQSLVFQHRVMVAALLQKPIGSALALEEE